MRTVPTCPVLQSPVRHARLRLQFDRWRALQVCCACTDARISTHSRQAFAPTRRGGEVVRLQSSTLVFARKMLKLIKTIFAGIRSPGVLPKNKERQRTAKSRQITNIPQTHRNRLRTFAYLAYPPNDHRRPYRDLNVQSFDITELTNRLYYYELIGVS